MSIESPLIEASMLNEQPRRKRRYKIFQSNTIQDNDNKEENSKNTEQCLNVPKTESKLIKVIGTTAQFIKLPKKQSHQVDFPSEEQPQFVLLTPNLQGIKTVDSDTFGLTNRFAVILDEPLVFIRGHQRKLNQESQLFKSVSQLKCSFADLSNQTNSFVQQVAQLGRSVNLRVSEVDNSLEELKKMQNQVMEMRRQSEGWQVKMVQLQEKMDALQLVKTGRLDDETKQQEFKMFMQANYKKPTDQDDQFTQTQFLPAYLIAQFIEMRKQRSIEEQQSKKQNQDNIGKQMKGFHQCLGITRDKYIKLASFILQQFPQRNLQQLSLNLLLRKGSFDVQCGWVGQKDDLEYKECLLFVLRTSQGTCVGGFISNYMIDEEVREDNHAFLFCMEEELFKFKIRDEYQKQAYQASKHYLVCFGSDLMLSTDCLEEQSYCEWPNAYRGDSQCQTLGQLATQFSFMIEHIEVYEVTF